MQAVYYILLFLTVILCFYLVMPFLFLLLSVFFRKRKIQSVEKEISIACVITAYKSTRLATPLIQSILKHSYSNYRIYLVADNCEEVELYVDDPRLVVLKTEKALNSKVRSMSYAMDHFVEPHTHVVIYDTDNLSTPDFLSKVNNFVQAGFHAVQGKRVAKNLDSLYARMDAAGEIYHNFTERKLPYEIRTSPSLAGSGMLIESGILREFLDFEDSLVKKVKSPEDKLLQSFLVNRGIKIAYVEDALVYDEKIESKQAARGQRIRWLKAYFDNIVRALSIMGKGFLKLSYHQVMFGIISLRLPLFMQVLGGVILVILNFFMDPLLSIIPLASLIIFGINFILVLKLDNAPKEVWTSLWGIPGFILNQVLSLFNLNRSNKDLLVTENKSMVNLDELESKNEN